MKGGALSRRTVTRLAALAVSCAAPRVAPAQDLPSRLEPEVRLDAILARRSVLHAGVGVSIPVATSVRVTLIGALGAAIDGGDGTSARVDLLARYLVDPLGQARWGVYGGGGVSARYDDDDWRGQLVVLLGANRRRGGRLTPFVEIGYGGGVRISAGVRRKRQ
ncbi:MAG: hypothetical protein ACREON_10005 [Gemmatimonadaceae bacterium]